MNTEMHIAASNGSKMPKMGSKWLNKLLVVSLAIIALFKSVLSTNLLSNFPKEINVYKDDVIGFEIHNFINGTQNYNQVFPNPTIRKYPDEERVHTFGFESRDKIVIESCKRTVVGNPLEYALICQQKSTDNTIKEGGTYIIYQKFTHTMKKVEEYVVQL